MQRILIIPIRFLISFIFSIIIMLFFCLLYFWGETASIESIPGEVLFRILPTVLGRIIYPAISSALLFSFFNYRIKKIPVAASLITSVIIFILLFSGYSMLSTFYSSSTDKIYKPLSTNQLQVTEKNIIYSKNVYKQSDDSDLVEGLIIKDRDGLVPGFKYYNSGKLLKKNNPELIINAEKKIKIVPANPVLGELLDPGIFLGSIIRNIGYFGELLTMIAEKQKNELLLYSLAATLFLMSCLLLKNTSNWPLLEFSQVLALHAIVYFLFTTFSMESKFISENFLKSVEQDRIALYSLFILTILIFLFGIFIRLSKNRTLK